MAWPTVGLLDNFTRSNEGPPPSAYWSTPAGLTGCVVTSNQLAANGAYGFCVFNTAYGSRQEVRISVPVMSGAIAVLAQMQNIDSVATIRGYGVTATGTTIYISRIDNGVGTTLGTPVSQVFSSGDELGIERDGAVINAYYKASGGTWTLIDTQTDSTYSGAGHPAITLIDTTARVGGLWAGDTIDPPGSPSVITGDGKVNRALFQKMRRDAPPSTTLLGRLTWADGNNDSRTLIQDWFFDAAASQSGDATPGASTIAFSPQTAQGSGGAQVNPTTQHTAMASSSVSASGGATANPAKSTLTFTALAATADGGSVAGDAYAGLVSLAISPSSASAVGGARAAPAHSSLAFSSFSVVGTGGANASLSPSEVVASAPAVVAGGGGAASAPVSSVEFSAPGASTSGGAAAQASQSTIAATSLPAAGTGGASAQAGVSSATFSPKSAQATGEAQANPAKATLAFAALDATANGGESIPGDANVSKSSLAITAFVVTASGGATAAISAGEMTALSHEVSASAGANAQAEKSAVEVNALSAVASAGANANCTAATISFVALPAEATGGAQAVPSVGGIAYGAIEANGSGGAVVDAGVCTLVFSPYPVFAGNYTSGTPDIITRGILLGADAALIELGFVVGGATLRAVSGATSLALSAAGNALGAAPIAHELGVVNSGH